ncbi:hypothetical protein H634G_07058 [Metarhizium anisopliae BRIP 53293]|uniref:Uncharacterized protein n=1 Tax=Metarhizium anisopliae BRIP 53293 TaxID=1291518 RepID=A0A0D9NTH2_METAN|nr:hypothetical protein H634G_07058 [Metarhizium anisopliae BRIP 53293]KJK94782.1 hypothetical protein H633G_01384 [Metarhizium anisopliae BRIP 53284]
MGANDHPNEALALRYIQENTSIPVPEVISSDWDCIGWTGSMCCTTKLGRANYRIIFTDGDIAARNTWYVTVASSPFWEYAGWYPEYWAYAFTISGLDSIDWETLGSRIPDLRPAL